MSAAQNRFYETCTPGSVDGWYIASRTRHAPRWRALRDSSGVRVLSSWIDEAGPGQTQDWADLWARCEREAVSARVFVLFIEEGDTDLRGALAEVGMRLAAGLPVYYVSRDCSIGKGLRSLARHPLVINAPHDIAHPIVAVCERIGPASTPAARMAV